MPDKLGSHDFWLLAPADAHHMAGEGGSEEWVGKLAGLIRDFDWPCVRQIIWQQGVSCGTVIGGIGLVPNKSFGCDNGATRWGLSGVEDCDGKSPIVLLREEVGNGKGI